MRSWYLNSKIWNTKYKRHNRIHVFLQIWVSTGVLKIKIIAVNRVVIEPTSTLTNTQSHKLEKTNLYWLSILNAGIFYETWKPKVIHEIMNYRINKLYTNEFLQNTYSMKIIYKTQWNLDNLDRVKPKTSLAGRKKSVNGIQQHDIPKSR